MSSGNSSSNNFVLNKDPAGLNVTVLSITLAIVLILLLVIIWYRNQNVDKKLYGRWISDNGNEIFIDSSTDLQSIHYDGVYLYNNNRRYKKVILCSVNERNIQ